MRHDHPWTFRSMGALEPVSLYSERKLKFKHILGSSLLGYWKMVYY